MSSTTPPAADEYGPNYAGYVGRIPPDQPILPLLATQLDELPQRLAVVPADRWSYRYAPGKWSVRDVIMHLNDVERIMVYRALRIGRGDTTPLPGFDENVYALAAGADALPLTAVAEEWAAVRRASLALFQHLPEAAWTRRGLANGVGVSVRGLAYIVAGHTIHHLSVLAERYGLWHPASAGRRHAR
jgi:DinB family protein